MSLSYTWKGGPPWDAFPCISEEVFCLTGNVKKEPPKIEIEKKVGNTTYIVTGHFASEGVTVSEKIRRLLDSDKQE